MAVSILLIEWKGIDVVLNEERAIYYAYTPFYKLNQEFSDFIFLFFILSRLSICRYLHSKILPIP